MASNAAMSDEEIRRKLKEYNINIPLTETTRKILVAKINSLSVKEKSPSRNAVAAKSKTRRTTSSLYSSGEDESEEDTRANRKGKMPPPSSTNQRTTRRQTIGIVAQTTKPESSVEPRSQFVTENKSPAISPNVTVRRGKSKNADDYDKGSDSDSPAVRVPVGRRSLPRLADLNRTTSTVDKEVGDLISTSKFLTRLSTVTDYLKKDEEDEDQVAERRDALLAYRKPVAISPPPFVSDFTRSFTRLPRYTYTTTPSQVGDSSANESYGASSSRHSTNGSFSSPAAGYHTEEESEGLWSNTHRVSKVLVGVAVVFFLALAIFYINMHGNEVASLEASSTRNKIPVCSSTDDGNELCLEDSQVLTARKLLTLVKPELEQRARRSACGPTLRDGTYISAGMSDKALTDWLVEYHDMSTAHATADLRALRLLLHFNPHWGVAVTSPLPHSGATVSADEVRLMVDSGGLVASAVSLPLPCHLKRQLAAFITVLVLAVTLVGSVLGVYRGAGWLKRRREREQQQVYDLVQRILEALQASCAGEQPYVAINHVRDQLIAPRERSGMAAVWTRAVQFLENNESRVRREAQLVSGEECPVWRWLPALTSSPSDQAGDGARNKQWHGQAFGTQPGAQNGAPLSPTPCLKLRHMFDDTEFGNEWVTKVQDALLHKCGQRANIIHLHVDRASNEGCVYMKLASKEDAGVAYRALHGWWFDSHLVTVKYLRLERYHERFPEAVNARVPLLPSTDEVDD